jgi:hypothetical protein
VWGKRCSISTVHWIINELNMTTLAQPITLVCNSYIALIPLAVRGGEEGGYILYQFRSQPHHNRKVRLIFTIKGCAYVCMYCDYTIKIIMIFRST